MKNLQHIEKILPDIDDAFNEFYNAMLSDEKLSIFFESEAQIENLVKMQKVHFTQTISMQENEIKAAYVKLGEYHYDIRIPYVDFIKGAQMLEEYFLLHTTKNIRSKEIMDDLFTYFRFMKSFTAKGYLNRMIQEDKRDINNFFIHASGNEESSLNASIINEKIVWLKNLLHQIENGIDIDIEETDKLLDSWLHEISFLSPEKKEFVNDLEKRIMINTQNLFYFLHKEDYLEMLPLYSSLLGIYKLTLLLNNVLTVEIANNTIEHLKTDQLSQLLRKESFVEFLKKEIKYAQREETYTFSVAYLDLDNFKHVNDSFGHYSGDKVIEKLGEVIRNSIRGSDIAFRIGGDEFAIIFKSASRESAKKACQKIKLEFSGLEFKFNDNRVFNVSMSIGIIEFNPDAINNYQDIITKVDTKLYEAKHDGKNQIAY
ncbi:MAG: GGDEF domain-containing protein [Campylobacterota bacterium]|nr:GGDEF domain-containing protein [Campylobacterota bacterium]